MLCPGLCPGLCHEVVATSLVLLLSFKDFRVALVAGTWRRSGRSLRSFNFWLLDPDIDDIDDIDEEAPQSKTFLTCFPTSDHSG